MKQRIVTGLIAGVVFLGLTFVGGWAFSALLLLLALIGYYEYVRMNGFRPGHPAALLGFAGMLLLAMPWESLGVQGPSMAAVIWCLMFGVLAITVLTKNRTTLDGASLLLLGAVYVGIGFGEMIHVRGLEPDGLLLTFMAFGCIWASDTGAYFTGRAFGRRKLWPSISPNKTVEGAAGGVVLALITSLVFAFAAPEAVGVGQALLVGLIASVAGQFGDLIQSAYKRIRGVKDSGRLLPGHGGVLDRCDSWLIVFPLLTLTGLLS